MPSRLIREGIIESERVNRLSGPAELFYRRLMNRADDYGRFHANPALLRASLFPLQLDRYSESDVKQMLSECTAPAPHPLIIIYDGGKHLQIMNFKQQTRSPSKFPQPSQDELLIKCEANATQPTKRMCSESESESESKAESEAYTPPYAAILKAIPEAVQKPTYEEVMIWARAYGFTGLDQQVNGSTLSEHIATDAKATPTLKWTQHGAKVIKYAIADAAGIHERSAPTSPRRSSPVWARLKVLQDQLKTLNGKTNHPTDADLKKKAELREQIKTLEDEIAKG